MGKWSIVCLALVFLMSTSVITSLLAETRGEPAQDEEAIREVVQLYFKGIIEYDEESLRKAFHPEAFVIGTDSSGELDKEPFQEWVLYTRNDAPDPTGRDTAIISIDLAGNAASVKTELDWPHVHYTDYLSLLKIDGQWVIVNKIWYKDKPKKD